MSESYLEAKAVLNDVKSPTWRFFKFRVLEGGDVDKSYVHCRLCLDQGSKKRGQIKYCGGTTNLTNHLKALHKADFKALESEKEPTGPKQITMDHFVAASGAKVAKVKWKMEEIDASPCEVVL